MKLNLASIAFRKYKLWHAILPLFVLANLAYLSHNIFTWAITLGFFFTIPGYLLLRQFTHGITTHWEITSLSIGLSLFMFTIGGLVLNSLHAFGLERPLTTLNIFISFDLITIVLLILNRAEQFNLKRPKLSITVEQAIVAVACTMLPILTIGGAIRLNNGASNILTMIVMACIAVLIVLLVARPSLKPVYAYALFTIGLSILFGNSLRGWLITGHDIHHEFSVFSAVMRIDYWIPHTSGDPYNACLSITILPTLIAKLTHIPNEYVYKAVYQILFASFLPTLFYMFRRFTSQPKALLGVFAFMTFPTFTNDLPFLNRQEIAFIFSILLLFVNFMPMPRRTKTSFTFMFLIGLILSHYSSSYVTIILLLVTPLFYRLFGRKITKADEHSLPLLRFSIIISALLLTFAWNVQVTASTGNLTNTIKSTFTDLFSRSADKPGFTYSLFAPPSSNTPEKKFAEYAATQNGSVKLVAKDQLPVTILGKTLARSVFRVHNVNTINVIFHAALAKVLQLLVVVGTVILVIRRHKYFSSKPEIYFLSLGCSCVFALGLFTLLPQLSVDYDVTRLFQQSLLVLWLPSILFAESLFYFLGRWKLPAAAALFGFLYLNLTGFIPQITGGFPPQLPLNNSGVYYDYFYTHKSDELGAQWLGANRDKRRNIYEDTTAASPLKTYKVAAGFVKNGDGYLYEDYTDTTRNLYKTIIQGEFIEYTNTSATSDRNLVYTSQETRIYLNNQGY